MNSSSNASHLQPLSSDKVELHPSVSARVSCGLHIPTSQAAGLFVSSVHDKKNLCPSLLNCLCHQVLRTLLLILNLVAQGQPFHPQIPSNENFDSLNYNADDVTPVDSLPRCYFRSSKSITHSHYTHKHHPLHDIHDGRRNADVGVAVD